MNQGTTRVPGQAVERRAGEAPGGQGFLSTHRITGRLTLESSGKDATLSAHSAHA